MKIVRLILFGLLALGLIACTGIFIFFQTFDTDQYLSQITKKASLVIGRPVSIAGVGLGISMRGVTLDAGPVTIGDDPAFTTQPFIKVEKISLSLDFISLILHREIHITEVLLDSPQLHFIRSLDGTINIHSLGQSRQPEVNSSAQDAGIGNKNILPKISIKQRASWGDTTINSIKIRGASISFIDQNQSFPVDIWITGLDADLKDFSLSKPFQLSFDASFYNDLPNLHGSGLVALQTEKNTLKRSVQISDLKLVADLSQIDAERFNGISPEMKGNSVIKNIAGKMQLAMASMQIGLSGDLTANGSLAVTGGIVKNFNIVKTVLAHTLGVFGGIQINIDNLFNGQLKDKLGAPDTVIKKVDVDFTYHDKTIYINDSLIETDIFELTAQGSVDQGLNLGLQTMLRFNKDVSVALVNQLDGFKFLYDDSDRIAIGASLTGVIPHLKYKPNKDFRKKSKRALMQEGGNILGVLLGGSPNPISSNGGPDEGSGKKSKKNFKNILKSLLQ